MEKNRKEPKKRSATARQVRPEFIDPQFFKSGVSVLIIDALMLIAGIICLKCAASSFKHDAVPLAFVLFAAGLGLVMAFFYRVDKTGRQFAFTSPEYAGDKIWHTCLKLTAAAGLAMLGTYFLKVNILPAVIAAFTAGLIQVSLIFRERPAGTAASPDRHPEDPAFGFKAISLIMIAAACILYYIAFLNFRNYRIMDAFIYFVLGASLFGFAPAGAGYSQPAGQDKGAVIFDLLFCIFIFACGVFIGTWKMMEIPPGALSDENLSIGMAKTVLESVNMPVVLASPAFNGMTLLHYWMLGIAGRISGMTLEAGKTLSAVTGALELVFVYLIVKELFNRRAAVLASALLSVFFMHVFYSRVSVLWIFVPAFASASFYFFCRAVKYGKTRDYVFSGAILALSMCFYSAGKAAPFVIAAYCLVMLAAKESRAGIKKNIKGLAMLTVAALLVFTPIINYIIHFPGLYFARFAGMSVVKGVPAGINGWQAVIDNIIKNLQMFVTVSADGYGHNLPSKPFFDGFVSFAAFAGAGFLFFTWKREASTFVFSWVFFGLLPGLLSRLGTSVDPYPARMVLGIPAVIITVALGIERLLSKVRSLWPRVFSILTPLAALYFFSWFAVNNIRDYFIVFPSDPHTRVMYNVGQKKQIDHILKNKNEMFLASPFLNRNLYLGTVNGLDGRLSFGDVSVFEPSKVYSTSKMDYGMIGEGIYRRTFGIYREYFEGATLATVYDSDFWRLDDGSPLKKCYGWKNPDKVIKINREIAATCDYDPRVNYVSYVTVDVPHSSMDAAHTLEIKYYKAGVLTGSGLLKDGPAGAGVDCDSAVVSGLIDIPDYRKYSFEIKGAAADIYINRARINGPVMMYKGLARVMIKIPRPAKDGFSLMWKPEGSAGFTPVEGRFFLNSGKLFGLMASYSRGNKIVYKMLEPDIDYRNYANKRRPAEYGVNTGSYDVAWDGFMILPEAGEYEFMLESIYQAKVTIDGLPVFSRADGANAVAQSWKIKLAKGRHRIKVNAAYKYVQYSWDPGSTLRLLYERPGKEMYEPVTYDMLAPGF